MVDSNGECGKRSGWWAVGFMNEMVVRGRKTMGGGGKMKENSVVTK